VTKVLSFMLGIFELSRYLSLFSVENVYFVPILGEVEGMNFAMCGAVQYSLPLILGVILSSEFSVVVFTTLWGTTALSKISSYEVSGRISGVDVISAGAANRGDANDSSVDSKNFFIAK